MADENKTSIFQKVLEAGTAMLDAQIAKSRDSVAKKPEYDEANFEFGKAITKDRNYYIGSQGFQEKPGALTYEYMRQMAVKSSIVSAIIRTRQNRVAAHSEYITEGNKKGFRIKLKHEVYELKKIQEELFGSEDEDSGESSEPKKDVKSAEEHVGDSVAEIAKAKGGLKGQDQSPGNSDDGEDLDPDMLDSLSQATEDDVPEEPEEEMSDADMVRAAKDELEKRTAKKKKAIAEFILHCGELEDRPFESRRWNFNSFLRAFTWDSLVYDLVAIERVPKQAEVLNDRFNMHHFYPVDGATVRFASPELAKYKDSEMPLSQDFLYPEEELKALGDKDVLVLDSKRLESNEYKYVQLIRGRIQRAFTAEEMRVGFRNPIADIYTNGYSISELEMLVALITSHLQTEFYNRSYFQQGFSAKGILHIKANLNRSKLEELRRNWNHMVKGNRNSFQTPIMAGMDEVQWIPLTQSHSEMEFTMWLNYLIRMICAIYQVDPSEIGYGIKDEGSGGGISGDNTKEKMKQSKDKGFVPMMKFVQDFINKNIIDDIDPDFMLEWTGLEEESETERIQRQEKEVQYKKTLNEIRAEDGLPPIKGADHLVLNPVYFQWFSTMSEEGQKIQQEAMQQQQEMAMAQGGPEEDGEQEPQEPSHRQQWEGEQAAAENDHARGMEGKKLDHKHAMEQERLKGKNKPKPKAVKKSKKIPRQVKIEYYQL